MWSRTNTRRFRAYAARSGKSPLRSARPCRDLDNPELKAFDNGFAIVGHEHLRALQPRNVSEVQDKFDRGYRLLGRLARVDA